MKINTQKPGPSSATKPATTSATTTATSAPAPPRAKVATAYALPTTKSTPIDNISKATFLIYGEKKIGKTSLAAQFPHAFFCMFEPGISGLSVYYEKMFDDKGKLQWPLFVKVVNALLSQDHAFENVVIDVMDKAYEACSEYICRDNGIETPGDLPYGKGWQLVREEFADQIGRLVQSKLGVIFLSHAKEQDFIERTGGTYTKIVPTASSQCKSYISGIADIIAYYGYYGDERLLTIRGSDSVESGNRLKYSFWIAGGYERGMKLLEQKKALFEKGELSAELEKEMNQEMDSLRVHSIPAGISEEETYQNLVRAFSNRQATNAAPTRYDASVEKRAPMTDKKKK